MPNQIQIKRSVNTATPPALAAGELAFSEASNNLFVGTSTAVNRVIGGAGTFATLASPALTGTPTAPTVPGSSDNSTKIATTAFVQAVTSSIIAGSGYAPLASPAFTGTPTSATNPPAADNTQALATTSWVTAFVAAKGYALDSTVVHLAGVETISGNKTFSGTVSGVTPTTTDSSTLLATTAFVKAQNYVNAAGASAAAPVQSVATKTGAVTLVVADVTGAAPLASPTFTGSPAAPTPATADSSTLVATTAFVKAQGYATTASVSTTYAPLASPALTGTPTAPTATAGTNTTQLATTAFVIAQISASAPVASVFGRTGAVVAAAGDYTVAQVTGAAPLASPTFTGTPAAPTAAPGTSTTEIATTAFVMTAGFATAVAASAGTYPKVTINAQGLVTSGSTLVAADVPKTLDHTWITDFDTQVRTSRLDQMAIPTATVNLNNQLLTGLATPVSSTDAANKNYVDSVAQGLDLKASCKCATTGNISLTGLQAIDGYTTLANDRVLVKNQTTATQNGIYVAVSGAWTRSTDFNSSTNATSGAYTFIENGTTQAATSWVVTTPDPITIGTTSIAWAQFAGAGTYSADGNGLKLTGSVFSVFGVANQITCTASGIGISSAYTTQVQGWINNPTSMTLDGGTF